MIHPRIPIPILALAGLMILLGHDLLMATDPHGSVMSGAHEHHNPEGDCHLTEGTRPVLPDSSNPVADRSTPCTQSAEADVRELRRIGWATRPGQPVDSLRAQLQVFLN